MKLLNQNNQTLFQDRLPFQSNELSIVAKVFIIALIITSIILSFPVFTYGAETTERIPVQVTEKSASLDMEIINTDSTANTFTLKISTNPNGQSINAVGAYLNFASSTMKATEINFENSFCDLFVVDTIDNENGRINIVCGKPYPGVALESTIAEITFQKFSTATSSIEFDPSSMVLANDGFGTDILKEIHNLE